MQTPTKPKLPTSTILAQKSEAAILNPKPVIFNWNGTPFDVLPMSDNVLMTITEELAKIMMLLDNLRQIGAMSDATQAIPFLPDIMKILLPNATRIIAACLDVDEALVNRHMRLGQKAQCLQIIIEAEDLPLLMEAFTSLTGAFDRLEAAPTAVAEPNAAE